MDLEVSFQKFIYQERSLETRGSWQHHCRSLYAVCSRVKQGRILGRVWAAVVPPKTPRDFMLSSMLFTFLFPTAIHVMNTPTSWREMPPDFPRESMVIPARIHPGPDVYGRKYGCSFVQLRGAESRHYYYRSLENRNRSYSVVRVHRKGMTTSHLTRKRSSLQIVLPRVESTHALSRT